MHRRRFILNSAGILVPLTLGVTPVSSLASRRRAMMGRKKSSGGGGGGSPAWSDDVDQASTDNTDFSANDAQNWVSITCGQAGNITKVRIYISLRFGAGNIKLAVYDNSDNLLEEVAGADPGTTGYYEPSITSIPVTMGQVVKLAWVPDTANFGYRYLAGVGTLSYNTIAGNYAAFATDPLIAPGGTVSRRYAAGVYIVP